MGSFDASTFDLYLTCSRPLLSGDIDALQDALWTAAPRWTSRVRLKSVGEWPIGVAIDMSRPGALGETIRRHLPGGDAWRATHQRGPASYHEVEIAGADRIGRLRLDLAASVGARDGRDAVWIEVTKPEIDGEPSEAWVSRVFPALTTAIRPTVARASRLGERMAVGRHTGSRLMPEWLTWIGERSTLDLEGGLAGIEGLSITEHGGGVLIQLDPSSMAYRRGTYLPRVRAVEAAIGKERFAALSAPPGARPASPPPAPPAPAGPKLRVRRTLLGLGPPIVEGQRVEGLRVAGERFVRSGGILQDFDAEGLQFDSVWLGPYDDSSDPVTVRRCRLKRTRVRDVVLGPAIIEDCEIDGLDGTLPQTSTLLLRHVTLKGPVDGLDIRAPRQLRAPGAVIARHEAFYRTVDWALDIRDAAFARCDINGVPGRLVRRDPATQVLVTAERAGAADWRSVTGGSLWEFAIEDLLDGGLESAVLVACPRSKSFDDDLRSLARLREAGIAEPD